MSLDRARRIADAVLLEGYVLYPYRASSTKNRYRFTFGVLAPRAWSEAGGCEAWWLEAQVLVEGGAGAELAGSLRFLQACRRTVEEAVDGAPAPAFRPVESLELGGRTLVSWDEGDVREVPLRHVVGAGPARVPFELPGGSEEELCRDAAGRVRARVRRERCALRGAVRIEARPVSSDPPLTRVVLRVENETPWEDLRARRDDAMRGACIATHLLLSVSGGAFVSLLDPPAWAQAAAVGCANMRTFPVLAGEPGRRDLLLSAPIILYDHPQLAPESPGDFFDATEIDELLALRTATLTDDEKREARATDPRAAELVERVDALPPELLERLHGAARGVRAGEMVPLAPIRPGARVRLRPGVRRTDAQDLLYAGCVATVREVRQDVDGRECLAVTIDDDPAAELHDWYGRYHHFYLDEVEPLAPAAAAREGGSASP